MKFTNPFKRQKNAASSSAIPEDLQQYYSGQASPVKRWLGFALRIVALLIIIVLIVWGGVWLVHKFTNRNVASKSATSQQATTQDKGNAATNKQSGSQSGSSQTGTSNNPNQPFETASPSTGQSNNAPDSSTATPTPTISGSTPTTSTPTTATTPGALTNTGPGETIVLAFVVALGGVIASYVWTLRKLRG